MISNQLAFSGMAGLFEAHPSTCEHLINSRNKPQNVAYIKGSRTRGTRDRYKSFPSHH